jgi:uncharacterized protein YhaN
MRIRRLELLRYGHFTNASFDLPAQPSDFHMVFGPNEAGKSTALSAIEDLLFGIAHNSRLNFVHDYASMRVGALVEDGARSLAFRRRKGNRDTLLTSDEAPMAGGEGTLAAFLGGSDRRHFTRMFCLDHARLGQGGREILDAQNDVGQTLFSAASGIVGLRGQLSRMNEEASALWAKRASQRKYNLADEKLKAAELALREHTVTASRWNELRNTLEEATLSYRAIETEIQAKSAESRKLNRIRRVCRHVRARAELDESMEALGRVAELPEGAADELNSAVDEKRQAGVRLAGLQEQIDSLGREIAASTYDERLIARAEEIDRLHERRIQIGSGVADLPKRRAELGVAETNLKRLAGELGWPQDAPEGIIAAIPQRSKVAQARALLTRRGELSTAVVNAGAALGEAKEGELALRGEIEAAGLPADLTAFAATVSTVRERGDLAARAALLEAEALTQRKAVDELLGAMRPPVPDAAGLAAIEVPPRALLETHRDRSRRQTQELQDCRNRIQSEERDLLRLCNAYDRIITDERAVSLEELRRARQHRDRGWSIIRRKHIEGSTVPDEELSAFGSDQSLADAYQQAVESADGAADQRFEKAEVAAELTVRSRQISEKKEALTSLREEERALAEQVDLLGAQWFRLWSGSAVVPLGPDAMIEWLDVRARVLQAVSRQIATEGDAQAARKDEAEARALLIEELTAARVEIAAAATRPLRAILEIAAEVQRRNENRAALVKSLEDRLRKASADVVRRQKTLDAVESDLSAWRSEWIAAISDIGLNPTSAFDIIDVQVSMIDELREIANRVSELRHERIEKIERDINAFANEVSQLLLDVAPGLSDQDPQNAVLELERRLVDSMKAFELATSTAKKVAEARHKFQECEQTQCEAQRRIESLQLAAGVDSVEDLRATIVQSERYRTLKLESEAVRKALVEDGDGLPISDLIAECTGADLDEVTAREQRIAEEMALSREHHMEAREILANARRSFEAIGGGDRAANAAADRQAALSEIRDVAEQYVNIRSGVLLLQWAIERYRLEKQAPLLKRAGTVFATLTGGSFKELRAEFDEHDKVHLVGVRPDGSAIPVSGMSTGSADQLYLALRVAAVEDSLDHGTPLPFIADDLFINFDDDRAAAGFKVLGDLAKRTQVIFFTHHQHLMSVAKRAIGSCPTITLPTSRDGSSDVSPGTGSLAAA